MTMTGDELKACCASAYASPAIRWLLGDSYHPGGAELTSHLIEALDVGPGKTVVDVASGPGTSAIQLAQESGCSVVGIELSADSVAAATRAAAEAGLDGEVRFIEGDAEALPLPDAGSDGALCECSLCTFPNKGAAAAEFARVLRPGARLALSDVVAEPDRLPSELTTVQAWVACVADARPLTEITALLGDAGFRINATERHDEALADLIQRVEGRLRTVSMLGDVLPAELRHTADWAIELCGTARTAVDDGALGYAVVIAQRR